MVCRGSSFPWGVDDVRVRPEFRREGRRWGWRWSRCRVAGGVTMSSGDRYLGREKRAVNRFTHHHVTFLPKVNVRDHLALVHSEVWCPCHICGTIP